MKWRSGVRAGQGRLIAVGVNDAGGKESSEKTDWVSMYLRATKNYLKKGLMCVRCIIDDNSVDAFSSHPTDNHAEYARATGRAVAAECVQRVSVTSGENRESEERNIEVVIHPHTVCSRGAREPSERDSEESSAQESYLAPREEGEEDRAHSGSSVKNLASLRTLQAFESANTLKLYCGDEREAHIGCWDEESLIATEIHMVIGSAYTGRWGLYTYRVSSSGAASGEERSEIMYNEDHESDGCYSECKTRRVLGAQVSKTMTKSVSERRRARVSVKQEGNYYRTNLQQGYNNHIDGGKLWGRGGGGEDGDMTFIIGVELEWMSDSLEWRGRSFKVTGGQGIGWSSIGSEEGVGGREGGKQVTQQCMVGEE
ncbi:hypothetical protein Tco_0697566 [Tanacetum coccineum]